MYIKAEMLCRIAPASERKSYVIELLPDLRQRCDPVSHLSANVDEDASEHRTRHGAYF